jgi:hypothetical protein
MTTIKELMLKTNNPMLKLRVKSTKISSNKKLYDQNEIVAIFLKKLIIVLIFSLSILEIFLSIHFHTKKKKLFLKKQKV